ncbi:DUF3105 domain-containing protein [Nocardioides marmoriginsengisoli]|uniref:DUF3105 domain-containing protein n=1 Tax=Nocardioides marmoriginsengisoli TaxID=661483 RepID=A0A3N0CHX8_9ACTN|nr:DUF3105 domain-containing protein [Nocardioides marmoriginsengisoli]RNL63042.1 DUF3105 domain-containing protein [Nocardioides marmoriginsengisoli]
MVEKMRQDQQRKERTRSFAILGVCVLIVAALIGTASWKAIQSNNEKKERAAKAITELGKAAAAADCDAILTKPTDKSQTHISAPQPITYADAPPSFGPHRPAAAPFGRPFYGADDRPEVAELVHNLEHGYVIAWYDDTAAKDKAEMDNLKSIAEKYQDAQERFIAAPWHPSDGAAFPEGKHIALTRWSADDKDQADESKQRGNWQYCGSVSGEVTNDFFKKWTNDQSPEPGLM